MLRSAFRQRLPLPALRRTFSAAHHPASSAGVDKDGTPFTDSPIRAFGREPTDRPYDRSKKLVLALYFGGVAGFMFLYSYAPDTSYLAPV